MLTDWWSDDPPTHLRRLLAPNPGPMTLEGTNTWLVGDPDAPVVLVDPGPPDERHLARIRAACPAGIDAIVLTHRHLDHAEAAAALAAEVGCPVRAADPTLVVGAPVLSDEDVLVVAGPPETSVRVIATPGHTADSVCLLVTRPGSAHLLTGDTVLGRGSTVIAEPDGDLGAYLDSLGRMRQVVDAAGVSRILPGHGPVVDDPGAVLEAYAAHRAARLDQVRAAVAAGAVTADEVVTAVYVGLEPRLRPAATQSVRAQLTYLRRHG